MSTEENSIVEMFLDKIQAENESMIKAIHRNVKRMMVAKDAEKYINEDDTDYKLIKIGAPVFGVGLVYEDIRGNTITKDIWIT